jgi:hypothetical protein
LPKKIPPANPPLFGQDSHAKGAEAARKKIHNYRTDPFTFTQLMNTPLPHLGWLKQIAELHQYLAFLSIASGNPASASSNIASMLALARTLDNEPCLISQLVRLRLIKMACVTLVEGSVR